MGMAIRSRITFHDNIADLKRALADGTRTIKVLKKAISKQARRQQAGKKAARRGKKRGG